MARKSKHESWLGRKRRVRKKARGNQEKPRLTVYRSGKHIYAQIIDDAAGTTVAAASSREKDFLSSVGDSKGSNKGGADKVGTLLGERAKAKGVERVVFDRNGFLYHGRVKALADAVREAGVKF